MSNKKVSKLIDLFNEFLSFKTRDKRKKIDELELIIRKLTKSKEKLKVKLNNSKKSDQKDLGLRLSIVKRELKNAKKLLESLED